ncbi:MAG TPA: glycosyltransferase 87 family protein, partial [Isosphaeraceae bacterium]|nr:glycosyltransferase 87 family protein [Isosphaeraceae bacterium]
MSDQASREVSPESRHHPLARRAWALLAVVLIGFWTYSLVRSVVDNRLYLGAWTWTFANPTLSDDFHYHIDHTARVLAAGQTIESETDIFCQQFPYPLMIPRLFCWVAWMSPQTAITVWTGALAAIFLISTWAVFRTRQRLKLTRVSPLWLLVLILYATPVLSAIERGQCDPLTLLFLIGASA